MPRATTGLSYLTFGLVLLGSVTFTVFVTLPQWTDFRDARGALERALAEREERRQFLMNLDARVRELATYKDDALALSVALPERPAPADILASLQGVAAGSGVTVAEVGESKPVVVGASEAAKAPGAAAGEDAEERQGYDGIVEMREFPVTVRGSYANLRSFLRDLERSVAFTDVRALKLSGRRAEEGDTLSAFLEANLTLRTYAQPATE